MGEMVSYASDGGTGKGYRALPPAGSGPGVLVVHESLELVGHIMSVADRFAEAGFVALAPDLHAGEATTEDPAARDLASAADHLGALPQTSGDGGIGVVGFGLGGSLALWLATISDRVTVVVAFYPDGAWQRPRPSWDRFAGKTAAIHCAEAGGGSDAPGIQTLHTEITNAGGACTRYDYPGTHHAFFNDDRPEAFAPDAAAGAWARTLDTLRTRLG